MALNNISWIRSNTIDQFLQQVIYVANKGRKSPFLIFLNNSLLKDMRVKISLRLTIREINDLNKIKLIGLRCYDDLIENLKALYSESTVRSFAVYDWYCDDEIQKNKFQRANALLWHIHNVCDYTNLQAYIRLPGEVDDSNLLEEKKTEFPEYSQLKILLSRYAYLDSSSSSSLETSSSVAPL